MTVDYIHETKSMHILTLRLRISMSGTTRILSSSVEKSKYYGQIKSRNDICLKKYF